jgi:AmmeMemoRadiSam system protein A
MTFNARERETLLRVARHSIVYGLNEGRALPVDPEKYASTLGVLRASFVTIKKRTELRGCIGSLEAVHPVVVDVARNAFSAAFRDPRFEPLGHDEIDEIEISISILTVPEKIECADEDELLRILTPHRDGLILEEGPRRATFLPSVWESLGTPKEFVSHLKRKAGLPGDYWSEQITVYRYFTESFPD